MVLKSATVTHCNDAQPNSAPLVQPCTYTFMETADAAKQHIHVPRTRQLPGTCRQPGDDSPAFGTVATCGLLYFSYFSTENGLRAMCARMTRRMAPCACDVQLVSTVSANSSSPSVRYPS